MKLLKLTAILTVLSVFVLTIVSCEKESDKKKDNLFIKNGIVMSGANESPAVTTSASGIFDVWYDKRTHILNYVVSWKDLPSNPVGFHIHGTAPAGFNAPVIQTFVLTGLGKSGSYAGNVLIDGVKFKESDLFGGLYYINMHTTVNTGGEIRGQIKFD